MSPVPQAPVETARLPFWQRISLVWIVPIGALIIALGVAYDQYRNLGPLITITFDDAAGITAGETMLRYRDVKVGAVESVEFTPDLAHVEVSVRLDKAIAGFVDDTAQFWVVRPEVTTQGVTGLDTVLSGVYLAGQWDTVPGGLTSSFVGLGEAPLLTAGEVGLDIVLRSTGGSLNGNTPILYKGVQVGRVGTAHVSEDGLTVEAAAVILAPYDNLVTANTRFFDASGFSFSLGTAGASVDFASLASLIAGGVSFDTFVSGAVLAESGQVFQVFADAPTARAAAFGRHDVTTLTLSAIFSGDVTGLTTGSPVEIEGLRIGEVTGINGVVTAQGAGGEQVQLQVLFDIQPARLGFEGEGAERQAMEYFYDRVDQGLRARLATANLLTGAVKLELFVPDDLPPGQIVAEPDDYPELPTAPAVLTSVGATAEGTLARIDALPIEELLGSAIAFLDNASLLIGNADLQQVPGEVNGLIGDIRTLTTSPEVQALPEQFGALMDDLTVTAAETRQVIEAARAGAAVERVLAAIDQIGAAAQTAQTGLDGAPEMIDQVTALAAEARQIPLADLGARADAILASAESLVGDEALQALPADVAEALASLKAAADDAAAMTAELRGSGAVAQLAEAVASAQAAIEAARPGLEAVPALVDEAQGLIARANALPLEDFAAEATRLATAAADIAASPEAQALPAEVSAALQRLRAAADEVTGITADLRASGAIEQLTAAIASADAALITARDAAEGLPALVDQARALVARANDLPLETFTAEATRLAAAAADLAASPEAQALPADLSAALAELTATLDDIRSGGAVDNANAALLSARDAAEALAAAANDLPALIDRANALAADASTALQSLDPNAAAVREARAALREIARAADAVGSLARAIERQPNSLILGR